MLPDPGTAPSNAGDSMAVRGGWVETDGAGSEGFLYSCTAQNWVEAIARDASKDDGLPLVPGKEAESLFVPPNPSLLWPSAVTTGQLLGMPTGTEEQNVGCKFTPSQFH